MATHHVPASAPGRSRQTLALVALLGGAMVTATYMQGALSVLSRFIIDDLGLTRSQLGVAFAAFSATGAVVSPVMGALTDRSPRRVMLALFAVSGGGMVLTALSPGFAVVLAGSMLGGLALGAGNPATNRVIAERIPVHRRGLVIGLKQAGPPMGLLATGVVLPALAVTFDWRVALLASALIPACGLLATLALVPPEIGQERRRDPAPPGARGAVLWLTVIGVAVALGLSAMIAFLPLYAQERVGLSATSAGALASLVGVTGVAGRIIWGNYGSRFARASTPLIAMSSLAVAAAVALALAQDWGPALLWMGGLTVGASMLAWHSVAWRVVVDQAGPAVGKASAVMQVGNSLGFAGGPALAGLVIDATDSYQLAWIGTALLFAGATLLTWWLRRHPPGG